MGKELSEKGKIVAQIKGVEGDVELDGDLIKIDKVKRTEHVREFVPNVIEPSFGIGRILYSIFEHQFWCRPDDADRGVLSLPPIVPTKVLLVPLSNNSELQPIVKKVSQALRKEKFHSRSTTLLPPLVKDMPETMNWVLHLVLPLILILSKMTPLLCVKEIQLNKLEDQFKKL